MKTLSPSMIASLAGPVTTLCRLVKITTLAGVIYALTDLDVSITVGGTLYRADIGIDASSIQTSDGTTQSSVDITLLLQPGFITREMLVAGLLDGASCVVSVCDWTTLNAETYYAGNIRHITFNDTQSATLEIASLLDPNLQLAADCYSYTCRVDLGSPQCGVPIASTQKTFTVTSITDKYLFQSSLTDADDYWVNGLVSFTSGQNAGLNVEVSGYAQANGAILLCLPTVYSLAVGDAGTIYRGCNKTPQDCYGKWNNMPNYRGEPTGIPKTSTTVATGTPTTTTAPAPTGTLTATAAELKVLKLYAAGGAAFNVNSAAQAQCIADGFLTGSSITGISITAAGLQQLALAGMST